MGDVEKICAIVLCQGRAYYREAFKCGQWPCGGTCGHIFGFRSRLCDGCRQGRICFDEGIVVEDHVKDGGAASVRAILPTGIGENGEISTWDAMVKADVVVEIGGTVGIEFRSLVGAARKVAHEPGESSVIDYPRGDASFCKFADSKENVSLCVVAKVEKSTHGGGEREAYFFCSTRLRSECGDWAIVFAESA